jgi:hypothetical protein
MSTASQSLINPQNAKSSTGPSSPAAKSVSTKPASKFALLPYESREEYDEALADYRRCFAPTDAHEEFLIARMVQSKWESDTPRKAGGLMSWAASKAVGLLV